MNGWDSSPHRPLWVLVTLGGFLLGGLLLLGPLVSAPTAAQTETATADDGASEEWVSPRTPWGEPDLQAIWSSGYILTPLERPDEFEGREFVTDDERGELEATALTRLDHSAGGTREIDIRAGGAVGTYNSAFSGTGYEVISTGRTSQIVDPPDGKVPWKPGVRDRLAAEVNVSSSERGFYLVEGDENPEDRRNDRCLGVTLPLRFAAAGSSATVHRIVQTPGQTTIYYEHGHQGGAYRQIPMDGRPHLPADFRQWLGDARGAWDGETLVIDTTNLTHQTNYEGARDNLHLVERYTSVGLGQLMYRVTVEDPTVFTRPWTIEIPMTRLDDRANQIYESACHEGNYALGNILAAARFVEQR